MSIPNTNNETVAIIAAALEVSSNIPPLSGSSSVQILRNRIGNFVEAYKEISAAVKGGQEPPSSE